MSWHKLSIPFMLMASLITGSGYSEEQRSATTVARWETEGTQQNIVISVSDLLTPSQREIVNSGFSTFTMLALSDSKISVSDQLPDARVVCTVKYDTWEERYQMIRVDTIPVQNLIAKDYKTWSNECLHYKITKPEWIRQLHSGGTLYAILQVRQSSPDEAAKIKDWLVRQQSGFMQGLYSHMLGDFQLTGSVRVVVQVPSAPTPGHDEPEHPTQGKKVP